MSFGGEFSVINFNADILNWKLTLEDLACILLRCILNVYTNPHLYKLKKQTKEQQNPVCDKRK